MTASQQGKEAVIEILDTGIGITSTDMERIWRPFEQVDNSFTRKYEGTGLGLPLARRFIETMGGTLALASKPGSGTSVRVSFPLTAAAAPVKPEKVSSVSASLVCVA